jgi:hypothetical protein
LIDFNSFDRFEYLNIEFSYSILRDLRVLKDSEIADIISFGREIKKLKIALF